MLSSNLHQKYCAFYDTARDRSTLDERTTTIVGLAAAMAIGCEP